MRFVAREIFGKTIYSDINFSNLKNELREADFSNVKLFNMVFENSSLIDVNFDNSVMDGCHFVSCVFSDLSNVKSIDSCAFDKSSFIRNFKNCPDIRYTRFSENQFSNLIDVNFYSCVFVKNSISNSKLHNVYFNSNIRQHVFENCVIENCKFEDIIIEASLISSTFNNCKFENTRTKMFALGNRKTTFNHSVFTKGKYNKSQLDNVEFNFCIINKIKCSDDYIKKSNFNYCVIEDVTVSENLIKDVKINSCKITRSNFLKCNIQDIEFAKTLSFNNTLKNVNIKESTTYQTSFVNDKMIQVVFARCKLEESRFGNINLIDIRLHDTDVYNCSCPECTHIPEEFAGPLIVPDCGSFIGWKLCQYGVGSSIVVKLEIPEHAKRTSFGRLCRCSKAKVLGFYESKDDEIEFSDDFLIHKFESFYNDLKPYEKVVRSYDTKNEKSVVYKKGEIVKIDNWTDHRTDPDAPGIHFMLTFDEASKTY